MTTKLQNKMAGIALGVTALYYSFGALAHELGHLIPLWIVGIDAELIFYEELSLTPVYVSPQQTVEGEMFRSLVAMSGGQVGSVFWISISALTVLLVKKFKLTDEKRTLGAYSASIMAFIGSSEAFGSIGEPFYLGWGSIEYIIPLSMISLTLGAFGIWQFKKAWKSRRVSDEELERSIRKKEFELYIEDVKELLNEIEDIDIPEPPKKTTNESSEAEDWGRPEASFNLELAQKLYDELASYRKVAEHFDVSYVTIRRKLKKLEECQEKQVGDIDDFIEEEEAE